MAQIKTKLFSVQSVQKYQSRHGAQNDEIVREYAERYRDGKDMAPIDVCGSPNMGYFIFDGHQRFAAMKLAGFTGDTEIIVNVVDARIEQSVVKWLAAGANTAHGLRRTNEDKRRAVEMALEAHPEQSDAVIADHVGVSREYVQRTRPQVVIKSQPETRQGKDGKAYPPPPPRPMPPKAHAAAGASGDNGGTPMHPSAATPPAASQKPEIPTQEESSGKRDCLMRPIPEDLQEHWARRQELNWHLSKLRDIQRSLVNGRDGRDPLYANVTQETIAYMTNIINALEDSMPHAVCPWCGGMNPGCKMCGNRGGFVSKFQIERFAKTDPEIWKRVSRVGEEVDDAVDDL